MNLIITDGGNREGTYGSYRIFSDDGRIISGRSLYWGVGDHNQAEYWILLKALESALTIGLEDVIIFTDSETVVEQLLFIRPLHAEKLKRIRKQILERLKCFNSWEIQHAPRAFIKTFLNH